MNHASAALPDAISRLLARPDLRIAPHERSISFASGLTEPFTVDQGGHVRLGPACLTRGEGAAALLRHALELALLLPRLPHAPALAGLASARTAAMFAAIHGAPAEAWHPIFAAAEPPSAALLHTVWPALAPLQRSTVPDDAAIATLCAAWPLLGPAEALLQSGGDQRLRVEPATGLNFYGCSHRPRPWAVTFASSTASSSSERGFAGAEAARQRVTLAALNNAAAEAMAEEAASVRDAIACHAGLPGGGAVVLAASGTDCELLALALAGGSGRPITNLLIAPEETGSGVPLAATGCHFAADTARGAAVRKGERIEGFPPEVALATVAARGADGAMRPPAAIAQACAAAVDQAVAEDRQVILHVLDIAKTGFLAPAIDMVKALADRHPDRLRVVVDACQGRLTRQHCEEYLRRGWFVLVTGSKFLTGPPFAGAVLIPPRHASCLSRSLPAGLAAYGASDEWPATARTGMLARGANYGLLLRWRAALAEWDALAAVPEARTREILIRFGTRVRQGIAANPDLALLESPAPERADESWDAVQTIIGFIIRPADPLDPAQARRVYHWLNADLRPALPPTLSAEQERLACLRCHIGQPVPLPGPEGRMMGVLRLSAGARLVSGEPSHHDLDEDARLLREIRDALSVLAKISLILEHWNALAQADPQPSF